MLVVVTVEDEEASVVLCDTVLQTVKKLDFA